MFVPLSRLRRVADQVSPVSSVVMGRGPSGRNWGGPKIYSMVRSEPAIADAALPPSGTAAWRDRRSDLARIGLICTSTRARLLLPLPGQRAALHRSRPGATSTIRSISRSRLSVNISSPWRSSPRRDDRRTVRPRTCSSVSAGGGAVRLMILPIRPPFSRARTALRLNRRRRSAGPRSFSVSWRAVHHTIGTEEDWRIERASIDKRLAGQSFMTFEIRRSNSGRRELGAGVARACRVCA